MLNRKVKKGIILAAGDGDRLGPVSNYSPKVLLPISNQKPLITFPLQALAASGIEEVAIVVGHLGDKVVRALNEGDKFGLKLHFIRNPDYLGGNAVSVWQAKKWAQGEPVILCMGDHIIEVKFIKLLLESRALRETLCVDHTPAPHHNVGEATKVIIDKNGCIKDIGKGLLRWDALDTGVFLLTDNFFQALDELIQCRGHDIEITDVVRFLVGKGHQFHTCDISGCFWTDVDTEEDLLRARMWN